MSSTDVTLIGIIVALVFAGGGIWIGGRGKVPVALCDMRHKNDDKLRDELEKRLERIENKIDSLLSSRKDDI